MIFLGKCLKLMTLGWGLDTPGYPIIFYLFEFGSMHENVIVAFG